MPSARYLKAEGWSVTPEVDFCDLVAERDGCRLFVEVKGRTTAPGLDVDTMYSQLLRRMPIDEDVNVRFAVVVPEDGLKAALRVSPRIRAMLRIDLYCVGDAEAVRGPIGRRGRR